MRTIKKLIRTIKKDPPIYWYQLDDGSEVSSLNKIPVGDKVRHWFDQKYSKEKIGMICQKCNTPIKNNEEMVAHEFCELPPHSSEIRRREV